MSIWDDMPFQPSSQQEAGKDQFLFEISYRSV